MQHLRSLECLFDRIATLAHVAQPLLTVEQYSRPAETPQQFMHGPGANDEIRLTPASWPQQSKDRAFSHVRHDRLELCNSRGGTFVPTTRFLVCAQHAKRETTLIRSPIRRSRIWCSASAPEHVRPMERAAESIYDQQWRGSTRRCFIKAFLVKIRAAIKVNSSFLLSTMSCYSRISFTPLNSHGVQMLNQGRF